MSVSDRLLLASLLLGVALGAGACALFALPLIFERIKAMSQQSDAILAKITAQTDALKAVTAAVDGLREGKTTIADEIAALKQKIADVGAGVDLTALEKAVDDHGAVIDGLKVAIPTGTPFQPSNN